MGEDDEKEEENEEEEEEEEKISLTPAGAPANTSETPGMWVEPRARSERAPSRRRSCGTPHPWSS